MPFRVSLFVTCLVDQFFPAVGLAMADVLQRVGCEVEFREAQTCCGQPAFNSGYASEARGVARHFLRVFSGAEYIVVPSGSCCSMIRNHIGDLLEHGSAEAEGSRAVTENVYEFSEFLLKVVGVEDVGARFPSVATYHDSCHALRELKLKQEPRRLLKNVKELELREMEPAEECCGFGGTFSVKFAHVSGSMVDDKVESILKTGADTVISLDSSCLMQIRGALSRRGLSIRAMHLAEVLAQTG